MRLRWRKSRGVRRSLGWLPFKVRTIPYAHGQVCYAGQWLPLWDSYGLSDFELRAGSISEDARGRWYLNVCVERPDFVGPKAVPAIDESVGIDLGLKDLATLATVPRKPLNSSTVTWSRRWPSLSARARPVASGADILAVGHGRLGAGISHL